MRAEAVKQMKIMDLFAHKSEVVPSRPPAAKELIDVEKTFEKITGEDERPLTFLEKISKQEKWRKIC